MKNELDKEMTFSQNEFAEMAADLNPIEMTQSKSKSLKERVMNRAFSSCPEGGETARNSELDWVSVTDNLDVKILTQDLEKKVQTAYWRMKPGAVIPSHYHESDEDCLVLEGDIRFGEHVLFSGDFHTMKKGTVHPEMHTISGALLYLRHDIHDDLDWLKV